MKMLLVLLTIISDDYYRRANFTHSIALIATSESKFDHLV